MNIHGQFEDIHRNVIEVFFTSDKHNERNVTINDDVSGIYFADDPVEISMEASAMHEHILKTKCRITLTANHFVGDLFYANEPRDIAVTIIKHNIKTHTHTTMFRGYVIPVTFTQPYARKYDEFSVNCVDYLSTLKYYNYKKLTFSTYESYSKTAGTVSFRGILDDAMSDLPEDMNIQYDGSKSVFLGSSEDIFGALHISERVILDETYDDIMSQENALEEVLRYLNLHIIQRSNTMFIFDWGTVSSTEAHEVQKEEYTSSNTTLSISKIKNQITVTDDVQSVDDIVTSPLDTDHITSDYGNSQKFMTEYAAAGEGVDARDAFVNMINGRNTDFEDTKIREWYMQVMRNPNWTLYAADGTDVYTKIYNQYGNGINQWGALQYTRQNDYTPLLVSFGSRDVKSVEQDTQAYYQRKPAMTNYLMISVNGDAYSRYHHDNYESYCDTKITNKLEAIATGAGIARFNNITTANINPSEEGTINYLVFEGKFILSPLAYRSASTNHWIDTPGWSHPAFTSDKFPISYAMDGDIIARTGYHCVGGSDNGDGRFYQVRFYNTEKYNDEPHAEDTLDLSTPWINEKRITEDPQKWPYDNVEFKYRYSAAGETDDKIWKIPVLACELKVGDKYCCEGYEQDGEAKRSVYHWYTESEALQHGVDTIFYLGFDPAIDDYLLNKEWEISSNIDQIKANVNAWGTAIPITKDDMLTGQVDFRILGVVNSTWNEITRRHPSFWRHTRWYENSYPVLDFVSNIFIKDFSCKIYSDNGGATITQDNDIVYVSDMANGNSAEGEKITFKFITQLTTSECIELGVKNTINVNSVTDGAGGYIHTIYCDMNKMEAKAEEHYVDEYYNEYSNPHIEMSVDLVANDYIVFSKQYTFRTLQRTLYETGYTLNLKQDSVHLKLRETL